MMTRLSDDETAMMSVGGSSSARPSIVALFEPPLVFDDRDWFLDCPAPREKICDDDLLRDTLVQSDERVDLDLFVAW